MASFTDRFRSKSSKTTNNHFLKSFFFYKEFIKVLFNYHSTSIDRYHLYNKISVKILFIISCIFVYLDRLRVTFSYSYTHTHERLITSIIHACAHSHGHAVTAWFIVLRARTSSRSTSIIGFPRSLDPLPTAFILFPSGTVGKKWLISTGIVISRGTRNAQR